MFLYPNRDRRKIEGRRGRKSDLAAVTLVSVALFAAGGCSAPTSYMGISLAPGATAPELQGLARSAHAGDKQAQLQLGIAYEEGRGVARDMGRARKLYALAAADGGGTIWVYQPPLKKGGSGRVVPVNLGPKVVGLAEAKDRLVRLRGVRQ